MNSHVKIAVENTKAKKIKIEFQNPSEHVMKLITLTKVNKLLTVLA